MARAFIPLINQPSIRYQGNISDMKAEGGCVRGWGLKGGGQQEAERGRANSVYFPSYGESSFKYIMYVYTYIHTYET